MCQHIPNTCDCLVRHTQPLLAFTNTFPIEFRSSFKPFAARTQQFVREQLGQDVEKVISPTIVGCATN